MKTDMSTPDFYTHRRLHVDLNQRHQTKKRI